MHVLLPAREGIPHTRHSRVMRGEQLSVVADSKWCIFLPRKRKRVSSGCELLVQRELRGVRIFEGVRCRGADRQAGLQGAHDRQARGGGGVPHRLHGGGG